jgi:hypothetical protein
MDVTLDESVINNMNTTDEVDTYINNRLKSSSAIKSLPGGVKLNTLTESSNVVSSGKLASAALPQDDDASDVESERAIASRIQALWH